MKEAFSYHMPTKVIYAHDGLKDLDRYINGRKALLVTSEGFAKRGGVERLQGLTDHIIHVVTKIKSHPEFKDLKEIYEKVHCLDFDVIVAVGGGSVLDAAKFLSVYDDTKEATFVEALIRGRGDKRGYRLIPVIAIPTTAGTGSEITPWATIWDMEEKKKYSLHLPDLFSEVALYDPLLTLTVPKEITIQTALDTLSHALESIWNKNANPITIMFAVKSAKLIVDNIVELANALDNITYRERIMKACMYAGLAFSNTQTAIAHGMSYYVTAHKGVPHGIACSFTLPMLIDNVIGKYDFVDQALLEIFGELSSRRLREILRALQISTAFEDYGIGEEELKGLVASLQNNQRAGNSLVTMGEA